MPDETVGGSTQLLMLTDAAIANTARLLTAEEPGVALRVAVQPGGCSGLRYQLYFTDEYKHVIARELAQCRDEGSCEPEDDATAAERLLLARKEDTLTWFGDVPVLVDAKSCLYLPGSTIDFSDTLQKTGYTILNPNAAGSCACGDSFH
jgi:Fe-S cluster assembly iron-binding protein IscA